MPLTPSEAENTCTLGSEFPTIKPVDMKHFAMWTAVVLNVILPFPSFCPAKPGKEAHRSPLEAMWAAFNDEFIDGIWWAMRGSGKTQNLAILTLMESIFKSKCLTTVLGGSLEQSQNIIKYSSDFWAMPLMPKDMLIGDVRGRGYDLNNGSKVTALAASSKSVRGPHPQRLKLDEVDEMDPVIFESALGQPMRKHGIPPQTLISSTLQHPVGMMATLLDQRSKNHMALFAWCVEEVREPRGFWTTEDLDHKKRLVTTDTWNSEYLLERPKVSGAVFDFLEVERAYERGQQWKNKRFRLYNSEGGIDWGFNTSVLQIVYPIFNRFIVYQTGFYTAMELGERCKEFARIANHFNMSVVQCDSNPKDSNFTLLKTFKNQKCFTKIVGIQFNQFKTLGVNVLRYMLNKDLIDICDEECKLKMQAYQYANEDMDKYLKEDDHAVDALVAWAVKYWQLLPKEDQKNKKSPDLTNQLHPIRY